MKNNLDSNGAEDVQHSFQTPIREAPCFEGDNLHKKKPFPTEKPRSSISTEFNGFFLQSFSTLLANELFFLSLILLHLKLDLQ